MSSDTLAKAPAAPDVPEHADSLRIVRQRRLGQWTAVVVLVLLGLAADSALRDEAFQWDVVDDHLTSYAVLRGLWLTLWLTAVMMALGSVLRTRIVLPPAMRSVVPPAGNMLTGTLKGTSIVSVIAVQDLLYSVQLVYRRTYRVIPLLMLATVWHTVATSALSLGRHCVEMHDARGPVPGITR